MKSVLGFILGLLGSVINLFAGLFFAGLFFLVLFAKGGLADLNVSEKIVNFAGVLSIWLIVLAILFFIVGILGFAFSAKMNRRDNSKVRRGGWWCLILGIITINVFLIIGGIFGIIHSREKGGSKVANVKVPQSKARQYVQNIQQRQPKVARNP